MRKLLSVAGFMVLLILACQKEVSYSLTDNAVPGTAVTTSVSGRIVDEAGTPVQGATVKAGSRTALTNLNGEFQIANTTLSEKAAFVSVTKTGYFTGSRTFVAKAGQKHYVEVQLLPQTIAGTVDAAAGGTVNLANGSTVTLPAAGVVSKSTGAAYTGTVQVAMAWIDPTSTSLMRQMPGDLRGINEANAEVGLQSFGMLAVELSSPGGEALQIAIGKKAGLQFPLPASISGSAPATIALWSFNDTTGLWKQEGTATKSGSVYKAEVSHFSFWNCDAPFPVVSFSARLVSQNGQPLRHALVKIKRPAIKDAWAGSGWTDSAGNVSGLVPANEALVLEVYTSYNCGQAIYTQNVGPYTAAANLGTVPVTLAATNSFTITGTVVNCSNTAVTAGYVAVSTGSGQYYVPVVSGAFSLTFNSCPGTQQTISYYAVDSANSVQSAPTTATLSTSSTALGAITACGVSTQQFINFTLNGTAYTLTAPPDSLLAISRQSSTSFYGFNIGSTVNTSFSTSFNGNATGTFPLTSLSIRTPNFGDSTSIPQNGINVTVSEYGATGSYISGSFSGTLRGSGASTHTIQCSFRVKRN